MAYVTWQVAQSARVSQSQPEFNPLPLAFTGLAVLAELLVHREDVHGGREDRLELVIKNDLALVLGILNNQSDTERQRVYDGGGLAAWRARRGQLNV